MKPTEVIQLAKNHECRRLRLSYCDFQGAWRQRTLPISRLSADLFKSGALLANGPSGQEESGHDSRLRIVPDPASARLGPLDNADALSMLCQVQEATQEVDHPCDARAAATRAMDHLRASGLATSCSVSIASEFYLFGAVRYENSPATSYYSLQSPHNGAEQAGLEALASPFEDMGSHATAGSEELCDAVMQALVAAGIDVSSTGASLGPGQSRIELGSCNLVEAADRTMWLKRTVKRAASERRMTATFMPLPLKGENSSRLGMGFRIQKDEANLFADSTDSGVPAPAQHFLQGVLAHAPALAAFTNASTNSYRPHSDKKQRAESWLPHYRPIEQDVYIPFGDASGNIYLALAAILLAGLDGMRQANASPAPANSATRGQAPASLEAALHALSADHAFLSAGNSLSDELIERWIEQKRRRDLQRVKSQPVPQEFQLYYDC